MSFLEVHTGPRAGERFRLTRRRVVIGRHPDCDLVIDAAAVSRQHAAVSLEEGRAFVEDLGSRNGTVLNGRPVNGRTELQPGDELRICDQRLVYAAGPPRHEDPATATHMDEDFVESGDEDSVVVSEVAVPRPSADEGLGVLAEAKLRAVIGLNRAIGASLSVAEVLPRLLEGLMQVFPQAERGFVLLVDPHSKRLALRARRARGDMEPGPPRLSLSLVHAVAGSGRAILSADAGRDSRFAAQQSLIDCRIRSVMCVPMTGADGVLIGVVQVDCRNLASGFDAEDLEVLAGIAGQAAQAVEQALAHDERVEREHINRDLELAHRVQQGLLPSHPPAIPGYDVFDFYEAARHVGGDFFGYVPLAGERMAVVLADVSGKGVPAALLMAALSADVRYCLASEPDVARAVARINESFLRGGWDDRFATLIVVVLDPRSHTATLCNAGHLPAFIREPDGRVRSVGADLGGMPLGMDPDAVYRHCRFEFAPGAVLVLCTDGISEALDHDQQCYGFDQLEQVLGRRASTAADVGHAILADVERHVAGNTRSDDMCLVCLGRPSVPTGAAQPAQNPAPVRRGAHVKAGRPAADT